MRDISLHLMDIMQNSVAAKAQKITVSIKEENNGGYITIAIEDNGKGMSQELLSQVTSPFVTSRSTRKVGLGIPLFMATAEQCGGSLNISSAVGKGTKLEVKLGLNNINRPPLGDIGETMAASIMSNPEIEFELKLESSKESFCFRTTDVKEQLGQVPIDNLEVIAWIKDYINEGIKITFGGVLDEIIG